MYKKALRVWFMYNLIQVFPLYIQLRRLTSQRMLCIYSLTCPKTLLACWMRLHLDLASTLWLTMWTAKAKFAVRWRSNFFSNFDHFYSPFNSVFYLELKTIKIFKIEPKLMFLHDVFSWNYFFGGMIPNFLPGVWRECEKFSEFI